MKRTLKLVRNTSKFPKYCGNEIPFWKLVYISLILSVRFVHVSILLIIRYDLYCPTPNDEIIPYDSMIYKLVTSFEGDIIDCPTGALCLEDTV